MSSNNRLHQPSLVACLLGATLWVAPVAQAQSVIDPFVERLTEPVMREFVLETLERNPRIGELAASARASGHRARQSGVLPHLAIQFTSFLDSPETRVGPQEWTLAASQALPWGGKRRLQTESANLEAAAQAQDADAARLAVLTQLRVLLLELDYVGRLIVINETSRSHLAQHEEIARARYATGSGPGQGVIKLQAAITRIEHQHLDLESRHLSLRSQINGLRDRAPTSPLPSTPATVADLVDLDYDLLLELAVERQPAMRAAVLRIDNAGSLNEAAGIASKPDFRLGLAYTQVGRREDEPGRLNPPPGNGGDILGIQASVLFPVQRGRVNSAVEEATEGLRRRQEHRRVVKSGLEQNVADLVLQLPIRWRQLQLIRDVLVVQAHEALDSATSGYIAGSLNSLDLLDAEHVLFDAETAVARAETDYLVARTRLEGAIGLPLEDIPAREVSR